MRLLVTFRVASGDHELTPIAELNLTDALGYQQAPLPPYAGCDTSGGGAYSAGGTLGPTPVCCEAGGSVHGHLSMVWIPSGLTGPQPGTSIDLP